MNNDILSAIIGLLGALIGAIIGGWITARSAKQQIDAMKEATERQIMEQKNIAERLSDESLSVARASSFMERFSSPSYMEIRDEVELLLMEMSKISPEERMAEFNLICLRDTEIRVRRFNRLHALGMFFAEIGVSFENGHLNCDGLAIFDRIIPYYWKEMEPFIRACHISFGFPLDSENSLADQPLIVFTKFRHAYKEMVRNGLAKEPVSNLTAA